MTESRNDIWSLYVERAVIGDYYASVGMTERLSCSSDSDVHCWITSATVDAGLGREYKVSRFRRPCRQSAAFI